MPVEGGLHQREPGAGVLRPDLRELHLQQRQVLLSGRRTPRRRRGLPALGPLRPVGLPEVLLGRTALIARPDEIVISRWAL